MVTTIYTKSQSHPFYTTESNQKGTKCKSQKSSILYYRK